MVRSGVTGCAGREGAISQQHNRHVSFLISPDIRSRRRITQSKRIRARAEFLTTRAVSKRNGLPTQSPCVVEFVFGHIKELVDYVCSPNSGVAWDLTSVEKYLDVEEDV